LLRIISKGDHSSKSAVPGVDRKDLFEIRVPVSPIEEQKAIVEYLELALVKLNRAAAAIEREIALLHEFRARLISDVVTGKLDLRAAAMALSETTQSELVDETSDVEDLEEAIDDVGDEAVAA